MRDGLLTFVLWFLSLTACIAATAGCVWAVIETNHVFLDVFFGGWAIITGLSGIAVFVTGVADVID